MEVRGILLPKENQLEYSGTAENADN